MATATHTEAPTTTEVRRWSPEAVRWIVRRGGQIVGTGVDTNEARARRTMADVIARTTA